MKMYKAKDVDTYIANSPAEARPKLAELRQIIQSTIPKAEEKIGHGGNDEGYQVQHGDMP